MDKNEGLAPIDDGDLPIVKLLNVQSGKMRSGKMSFAKYTEVSDNSNRVVILMNPHTEISENTNWVVNSMSLIAGV